MKHWFISRQVVLLVITVVLLTSCVGMGDATDPANTAAANNGHGDISSYLNKGDDALAREAYDDAQIQYALAVNEQPNNTSLLFKLAFVHYQKGSHEVARELLTRITSIENTHSGAYEMLGLIALKGESISKAEKHFLKSLTLDSQLWRSLNAMGIVKDLQSKHSEAQVYFRRAIATGSANPQIENNLGYSYYLEGRDALAMQHFRKATRIDSAYDKAWANLGLALVRLKQYEEARFAFEKVVDSSLAANNIGYLAMLQGDMSTANRELNSAIQLAPSHYAKANENLLIAQDRMNKSAASASPTVASGDSHAQSDAASPGPANIIVQPASYRSLDEVSAVPQVTETSPIALNQVKTLGTPKAVKKSNSMNTMGKSLASSSLYLLGFQSKPDGGNNSDIQSSSVISFQIANDISPSGKLDTATLKKLKLKTNQRVRLYLDSLGFGGIDAEENDFAHPSLALKQFQSQQGLDSSGIINRQSLIRLKSLLNL